MGENSYRASREAFFVRSPLLHLQSMGKRSSEGGEGGRLLVAATVLQCYSVLTSVVLESSKKLLYTSTMMSQRSASELWSSSTNVIHNDTTVYSPLYSVYTICSSIFLGRSKLDQAA